LPPSRSLSQRLPASRPMFYSQYVLAKKGALGKIWLAAHMEKKVSKVQIIATNIPESVDNIENPKVPMALRVSGHLLLGVVRIFSRKVQFLLTDCNEALVKISDAFKKPGTVDLPQGATTRRFDDITNPDHFDEMDLEADLASQPMNFTMADDALEGIHLPDVDELVETEAIQMRSDDVDPLGEQPGQGFGHNNEFQVFFEDHQAFDDPPPSQKRRRASDLDEVEVLRSNGVQPEVEVFLDDGLQAAKGFAEEEEDVRDLEPQPEEVEKPMFDEEQDVDFPEVEPPVEPPPKRAGQLNEVMETDDVQPPAQPMESDVSRASQPAARRAKSKRKMIFDDELQVSPEQMREQIDDTSSIVRTIGDAPLPSSSRADASYKFNPFTGPPSLSFLPAAVADMRCFQPNVKLPSAKRARKAREQEEREQENEPEQWREQQAHDEPEVEPLAFGQQSDVVSEGEMMPEDVKVQFDVHDDLDELPPPEEEAPVDAAQPDIDAFETSHRLPEVDAGDSVAVSRNTPGKGKKKGAVPDAEAWSKRTHNMYLMLGEAFKESGDMPLSYDAMIAQTSGRDKRRVVAGCFQELLFLSTHGLIDLEQQRPYSNIVVSKTENFENVTAH